VKFVLYRFPVVVRPLCVLPAQYRDDEPGWLLGGFGVQCVDEAALHRHDPDGSHLGLHDGLQRLARQSLHRSAVPAVDQVVQHLPIQHECTLKY